MKTGGRLSKLINMKTIVLLRHGESTWNRENRFTGWTDVDLTELGIQEANHAGDLLKDRGMAFDHAYTSYLKRAVKTLNCVLDRLDQDWLPVSKSWRLNEKHYGMLQGLNKSETAQKYGDEQVLIWRLQFMTWRLLPLAEDDPPTQMGSPLQGSAGQRTSANGITERNYCPHDALLGRNSSPFSTDAGQYPDRSPRQHIAGHDQVFEKHS